MDPEILKSSFAVVERPMHADANGRGASCITTANSRVAVLVVPTNEELMIARHTRAVLEPEVAGVPA